MEQYPPAAGDLGPNVLPDLRWLPEAGRRHFPRNPWSPIWREQASLSGTTLLFQAEGCCLAVRPGCLTSLFAAGFDWVSQRSNFTVQLTGSVAWQRQALPLLVGGPCSQICLGCYFCPSSNFTDTSSDRRLERQREGAVCF